MGEKRKCIHCGSQNVSCFDESLNWFKDKETGEFFEYPVGFFFCRDCKKGFGVYDMEGVEWIGDDRQMFGEYR